MYSNYTTITQRRLAAQAIAENQHRIAMVVDLKDAVSSLHSYT